jgi:hypothetical protein
MMQIIEAFIYREVLPDTPDGWTRSARPYSLSRKMPRAYWMAC